MLGRVSGDPRGLGNTEGSELLKRQICNVSCTTSMVDVCIMHEEHTFVAVVVTVLGLAV